MLLYFTAADQRETAGEICLVRDIWGVSCLTSSGDTDVVAIYTGYLLVIVLPTNYVSPPGKHFIPLCLSTSLNLLLTIFRPDPCVLPIQISLPDYPVLLATFPLGPFLCLHLLLGTLSAHIRSIDTLSTFKCHLKFHLFQSVFAV